MYSWAVPDRRYTAWVKDKKTFFMFLAICNMVMYGLMIIGGTYLYELARVGKADGMIGYLGYALVVFTLCSQTPMIVMLIITMITVGKRFDYENVPYQAPMFRPKPHQLQASSTKSESNTRISIVYL